jgi:hypothetical protein
VVVVIILSFEKGYLMQLSYVVNHYLFVYLFLDIRIIFSYSSILLIFILITIFAWKTV